jgi:hypothetical protein
MQVIQAAKEYVGWDEVAPQQQQQQQQHTLDAHSAATSPPYSPPLALTGNLFDHSSTMQIELRENLQKDVCVPSFDQPPICFCSIPVT